MRKKAAPLLVALLLSCLAGTAFATQYPNATYPDTLTISHLQNPASVPFPVPRDTVRGVAGIVTGFDLFPTGFALYIQNSQGGPWTGIDVFSGGTNKKAQLGLEIGDSVVVYGAKQEFQGESEIEGLDTSQSTDDLIVRKVSSGNPLPPFFRTTANVLQELPTNPNAEQWEGCLVRVVGPLRVVRNNTTGGNLGFRWAIAVDNNACGAGPCDSLFIDLSTLPNPAVDPPAIGAIVDSVQGIYNQRNRGYRVQVRDCSDIFGGQIPPSLADAFPIEDNKIRLLLGCPCSQATAEDVDNYSLGSFGAVLSATQVSPSVVDLVINNGLVDGNPESVTAVDLFSPQTGGTLTTPQTRNFINGVLDIAFVQAPNPDSLGVCVDRSRFAGTGSLGGPRMSLRGIAVKNFGNSFYLMDENGQLRGGIQAFAPGAPLVPGRRYLLAGAIQEFFGETELIQNVFVQDEGPGVIPAPYEATFATLRNWSCDATQSTLEAEDLEGMLVKLPYVEAQDNSPVVGGFFDVWPLNSAPGSDSLNIDRNGPFTYQAIKDQTVSVTGIFRFSFNQFRIDPRNDADILVHGLNVDVGPTPTRLSFAVAPNPAKVAQLTFALPTAGGVDVGVFDVAGRRIATVFKGNLAAGTHARQWNGRMDDGSVAGAGVYFYRLAVDGADPITVRGVRLQ